MKVSVIIPVHNAEKYLPVCLESLAIQTMRDFEVIVVDDCSTDNSVAIAESFVERFGGRLKIFMLSANTGSGAVPRNVGLECARGEYVFFVDNDDLLIDNALETLYDAATEYRADVVYTVLYATCGAKPVPTELNVVVREPAFTVDEPTLMPDDFSERVKLFSDGYVRWPPWTKFLRRQFLIDNDIKFLPFKIAEDGIWTLELLCLAQRWLHVPQPLYIYRTNKTSIMNRTRSPQDELKFWLSPLITGADYLDEFMRRFEFFGRHPNCKVRVLKALLNECFEHMSRAFKELEPREAYEIFLCELDKSSGKHPALIAALFMIANDY